MRREAPAVRLRGFQGSANCSANCSAQLLCLGLLLAVWLAGGTAQRRCGDATVILLLSYCYYYSPSHRPTPPLTHPYPPSILTNLIHHLSERPRAPPKIATPLPEPVCTCLVAYLACLKPYQKDIRAEPRQSHLGHLRVRRAYLNT